VSLFVTVAVVVGVIASDTDRVNRNQVVRNIQ